MTVKIIKTQNVKVQASPAHANGITPLGIYNATREVVERTVKTTGNAAGSVTWETEQTITDVIYTVADDNDETHRFGSECFRVI